MLDFENIRLNEIAAYKDPFALFDEGAIALAQGEDGENIACITIGWGAIGTLFSEPTATVYIHKTRYSERIFRKANRFSICFFGKEYTQDVNQYYGAKSSRDIDKFNEGPLSPAFFDDVPIFKQAELVIICEKSAEAFFTAETVSNHPRIETWYADKGGHTVFSGRVLHVLKHK